MEHCRRAPRSRLDHKQIERALEKGKKLILIGIDNEDTKRNDGGYECAMAMNHEEDSHANDELDGDGHDIYEDCERYFGFHEFYSPDNRDIRENPKYKDTRAKKASDEILKFIAKQLEQQLEKERKKGKE